MSDIYYAGYNEGEDEEIKSPRGSFIWTIKLIFKTLAAIIILGTLGILLVRMILARPPADIIRFHWTEAAIAAFDGDDESFRVYRHTLRSYTIDTESGPMVVPISGTARSEVREIDGHIVVRSILYTPMLTQLQFTFSYTTTALNYIESFFDVGHQEGELPLWFTLSPTPGGTPPFTGFYYRKLQHNRYTYVRILFYGINLEEVDRLYLNVHHVNAIDHSLPFMSMRIYDNNLPLDEYAIVSRDTSRGADGFEQAIAGPAYTPSIEDEME
ncbi:MAG: hypothetical protein FWB93_05795 [Oscillospiraceae bacterium]|nr:hypothetical protein [Oscillospiraceae bacterium]